MFGFLKKVFGTKSEKDIRDVEPIVDEINSIYATLANISNDELRAKSKSLKDKIQEHIKEERSKIDGINAEMDAKPDMDVNTKEELYKEIDDIEVEITKKIEDVLNEILPEAFAILKDTARRFTENKELEVTALDYDKEFSKTLKHIEMRGGKAVWKNSWTAAGAEITWDMVHYDVQLIGGIVLHQGKISEMGTGEGKTLVSTLPVFLNALAGRGVHLVTVNNYLAKRDSEWNAPLFQFHGLTVDCIDKHEPNTEERRLAYLCDITYGTNNEFGFDYLRDNMKYDLNDYVQREHHFAIVDECDSILIDEARTPLIISGPAEASTDKYVKVNAIIPSLKKDVHFTMEEKSKTASLTEEGNAKVEELLKVGNIYDPENIELLHHVYQALKAHHLYRLDVEYMIKDGEIVIVDEFTGRLMPGRRWSDGLHQAIEAKENVRVRSENQTLATITFQNYFLMYKKLAGMTGTADTEAVEFKKIYNLDVNVIPTNRPIQRDDLDDIVYKTERAKFKAIAADIKERHSRGQPVLVGTVSIEKSESLSAWLKKEGVRHDVLNAKHHEREAEIVAQAGRKGAITIATNMAGRGTDIVLGGNAEVMARKTVGEVTEDNKSEFESTLEKYKKQCEIERIDVVAAGGLCIIGTERHESRRIDNQLRGRSGRQGDPGVSRFYLSLEDGLMRIFN